jgi:hypothetical protein
MWDIILAERARRSIIFTTHFLDEGEVLADHIVLLSEGHIKCQGSAAELKTRSGGGYRVHLPQTEPIKGLDLPVEVHQDRLIYRTEDSRSAARLVTQLEAAGHKEVQMAGPTIEDVFLNLTKEVLPPEDDAITSETTEDHLTKQLSSGQRTSFWTQVRVLLRKRLRVLPRYWMSTLLALILPIACVPAINTFVATDYTRPGCQPQHYADWVYPMQLYSYFVPSPDDPYYSQYRFAGMPVGPRLVNESLYTVLRDYPIGASFNISQYDRQIALIDDFPAFQQYVLLNNASLTRGVYMGDAANAPLLTSGGGYGGLSDETEALLNLWSQVRSQVPIAVTKGYMNGVYYMV